MLNTNFHKIGLICVLGVAACGESEDPSAPTTQPTIEDWSTSVVDLNLIGTFMSDSLRAGDLTQLVLKTNGTFHSATLVECAAPPCNPLQEDGIYRISWRDSHRFITLYDTDDTVMSRYRYAWLDNTLRLLKDIPELEAIPGAGWLPMWLSTTAWCATPTANAASDCQLQNLPIGPCSGEWSCVSNVCNWDCGVYR